VRRRGGSAQTAQTLLLYLVLACLLSLSLSCLDPDPEVGGGQTVEPLFCDVRVTVRQRPSLYISQVSSIAPTDLVDADATRLVRASHALYRPEVSSLEALPIPPLALIKIQIGKAICNPISTFRTIMVHY
jgi:hypothetical protein